MQLGQDQIQRPVVFLERYVSSGAQPVSMNWLRSFCVTPKVMNSLGFMPSGS